MATLDPASAKSAGRRAARAVVRRAPLGPVATLPASGGAVGQRAVFTQARMLMVNGSEHARGVRLLSRLPPAALGATGHAMLAWGHLSLGALDLAVDHARSALALEADAEATGLVLAVARRSRDAELHDRARDRVMLVTPTTTRDAERLVSWFVTSDLETARSFVRHASSWQVSYNRSAVEQIEAETRIRAQDGVDAQARTALAVGQEGATGFRAASAMLNELDRFDELRELWAAAPLTHVRAVSHKVVLPVAARAARAGWLDTAQTMAGRVIEVRGDRRARALHARVSDQIMISRTGWPVDEVQERSYEPRPGAVLSVLAQSLPHRSGGYATRSHGVLTGLRSLGWDMRAVTRLGFPYDFWSSSDRRVVDEVDVVDGVPYVRLLEPGEREYETVPMASYVERFSRRIEEVAREHRAGLIHASSFQNNGLAGLRAARRLGIPFVYEMRGLEDLMKISRNPAFGGTDAYAYMTTLELHVVQHADLTFVITEALREEMIARGGPADRIKVLPNGVHTSRFEPREPDRSLVEELDIAGKTVIGYAGSLVDYEGIELLLRAAAELKGERDDFAVVVVGDGHHQAVLHRLARELDVLDVVTFTGRVPHDEVARYLSIFEITPLMRLPLPVCELISPIKPFESMAMGKAMISSSVAALAEIVAADERGLVFDKGDAGSLATQIRRYLDDPELRERMGRQAREWVLAERDWSDVTQIVDREYHRLLR
ncbi:hypothetical protein AWH69_00780 [Janibacter melonis]|uniref:D-inositol 3-phosphate glycosyltransferase n=1 Tax=Janibacter melonis TaxID=262209 RepID=A0A176QFB1_9MICO|nr:glycosyltransferase family 4 protein [Janibacter melonis]OAB88382.1 hypothetical protein AWH69_00780 [Janibacter melonis]